MRKPGLSLDLKRFVMVCSSVVKKRKFSHRTSYFVEGIIERVNVTHTYRFRVPTSGFVSTISLLFGFFLSRFFSFFLRELLLIDCVVAKSRPCVDLHQEGALGWVGHVTRWTLPNKENHTKRIKLSINNISSGNNDHDDD